MQEIEKMQ